MMPIAISSTCPADRCGNGIPVMERPRRRIASPTVSRARTHRGRGGGNVSSLASRSSISCCSLSGISASCLCGNKHLISPHYTSPAFVAGSFVHLAQHSATAIINAILPDLPMDWREEYKRRLASHEEAMTHVRRGDLVVIPIAGPRTLPRARFRRCQEIGPIDLRLSAPLTDPGWLRDGSQETFRIEFELFIGDFARPTMDDGRATYLPNLFSLNLKEHNEERPERRPIDVFLTAVTPPDEDGYVSFGAHNWNKRSYIRCARTSIVEVDPSLRPVCGDNKIHVTEIDRFVEIPPLE